MNDILYYFLSNLNSFMADDKTGEKVALKTYIEGESKALSRAQNVIEMLFKFLLALLI